MSYESPIKLIEEQMRIEYENECMKAVYSAGLNVNKEELTKALMYDRGQYDEGYNDGYSAGKKAAMKEVLLLCKERFGVELEDEDDV